jgi:hypothetical protein
MNHTAVEPHGAAPPVTSRAIRSRLFQHFHRFLTLMSDPSPVDRYSGQTMSRSTQVPPNTDLQLRLLVGGNLPYKWQLYEYKAPGAPPVALPGGSGQGSERIGIAAVAPDQLRRFVWSVAAVNTDAAQDVDVRAQALSTNAVVGELVATWNVEHAGGSCFMYFDLEGKP